MKKILLYLLLVVTASSFIQSKEDKYLFWDFESHLKWTDFHGHIKPDDEHAASASYIGFFHKIRRCEHRDSVLLDTRTFFNKTASWVRVPAVNPSLLLHEQRHFDLTELYARHFRKALQQLPVKENFLSLQVDSVYKYYTAKCDSMHVVYDFETNHGLNPIEQFKWNEYIRYNLLAMNEYEPAYFKIAVQRIR